METGEVVVYCSSRSSDDSMEFGILIIVTFSAMFWP